ncbi:U3 small nucleolar ribonucleoprotein complex, subunit Mpp10 [Phakopsora pachyrhizi]|uniref:U3 small nucleolar ribonucleo protein complex, subunit Mpp10 n=1 Tax=Phakopsora pachyrhizi TaxID=170000 RepID=A0AAV0BKV5_PHAPC|nr:U3 small nucleolar ribonucleoprotein complex, subunit Mpp10 [Phakopsora pachyrhizi]CAH7686955.1 U3 small nucleolar ribonucleo protein complex, subunit Mpp10 [Phakopsora pachyrhizi]
MRVLSKQIAELEAENVSKKDWTLKGETGARERPQNSLLEQDLDFEHVQKIVPAVTEERTLSLEALIKKRIIEGQFDDVVRKRLINHKAFLPSRFLELQDTKSSRSLTDLYEDSFQSSKQKHQQGEGGVTLSESIDPKDEKLSKEHLEITELVEDLFGKLDALSNAHFTPKVPKPTIKTVSDLPSISLESSLPTGTGTTTILAPEEIYSLKSSKEIYRDYEDLGHAQKQAERQAKKRKRRADEKRVEEALGDRKRKREKDFKNGDGGTPKKGKESQSKRRSVKEDKLKSLKELEGVKGVQILKTK